MKILFTFRPPRTWQDQLSTAFPEETFSYYKSIEEAEGLAEAEVIVTFGEDLTKEHIDHCPKLKWIMVASAGMEKMPFESIQQRGILVTNARGIHKIPMAEFTIGYMLNHVKRFPELLDLQEQRTWNKRLSIGELAGKHLLMLGTGAIGTEIARLAKAFRMETTGVNRSGHENAYFDRIYTMDKLSTLLPQADFIVSILPSTEETRHLLKKEDFEAMKGTAAFINIGRGDLLEEEVLMEALKNNEIAHAYLDVFVEEPLPDNHPLWSQENVTITPHISSVTSEYVPRALRIFMHNLEIYKQNGTDYENKVDPQKGY
ncbi:3-phosphoglycerate dehydrogenase [Bacillus sp. FJAT-27231]|uniref:D-2-hydroxyacid dehydrogenase n=1 Tax=Bacillus sp. FJAT-27231 TaxID=1679168 RepID=UPI000670D29B|nr:D-2-hydroxyacid dehydrogenase [Bacillus sp. FJAT-27231]KMY53115.1 3-phosphoglycerate dehydrogenase [Bacillus sp. FJAT-27231]